MPMKRILFAPALIALLILIPSCSKEFPIEPKNSIEEKIEETKNGVIQTVAPTKDSEIILVNELSIRIPANAVKAADYPDGLIVEVERVTAETMDNAGDLYVEVQPFSPIYHIDVDGAAFEQAVTVRIPVSNIDILTGLEISDFQIVTWADSSGSLDFEYLNTTVSNDGRYLMADVHHFSFVAVKIHEGVNVFDGSSLNIDELLHITISKDKIELGNISSYTDIDMLSWSGMMKSTPRSWWINYQVEVVKDGILNNDEIATIQIYRLFWYPASIWNAVWKENIHSEAGDLYRRSAFNLVERSVPVEGNAENVGIEKIIIYDQDENIINETEEYIEINTSDYSYLLQVFNTEQISRFCPTSVFDDPEGSYFVKIEREYDGGGGSSDSVTSDKFTPYDIAPVIALSEPENASSVLSLSPGFSWETISLADVYVYHELILSKDADPVTHQDIVIPMGSNTMLPENSDKLNLDDGANYYWCVRGVTQKGTREVTESYSSVRSFIVDGPEAYTLSGRVIEEGSGLLGVKVTITGTEFFKETMTGNDGFYTFINLPGISYEITPSLAGYMFVPENQMVSAIVDDTIVEDFIAVREGGGGGSNPYPVHGIDFVPIPGGTFQMGDEVGDLWSGCRPVHAVTLSSYEMSNYEITNAQYAQYLNEAKAENTIIIKKEIVTGASGSWSGQEYIYLSGYLRSYPGNDCKIATDSGNNFRVKNGYENWPVTWVTWYGAKAFAEHYGIDLPTEAEWEYACRGGQQYLYGTDDGTLDTSKVNYWDSEIDHPVPYYSYFANPFGLYNMSGNVWEWCHDWYGDYPSESVTDPTGPQDGSVRLLRGGGWYEYGSGQCRSAGRTGDYPGSRHGSIGFRVVRRFSGVVY